MRCALLTAAIGLGACAGGAADRSLADGSAPAPADLAPAAALDLAAAGTCPTAAPPTGGLMIACSGQAACDYPAPSGRVEHCVCDGARWRCSDCPWSSPPTGDVPCAPPGDGCTIDTWAATVACRCTVEGRWLCCGSDALDACPSAPVEGAACCPPRGGTCVAPAPDGGVPRYCSCSGGVWTCG